MDECCGKRFEADMQARVVQSIRGHQQPDVCSGEKGPGCAGGTDGLAGIQHPYSQIRKIAALKNQI